MSKVVVEREFEEPVTLEVYSKLRQGASWCLDTYRVTHLQSLLSNDDKRMICIYDAPDLEAVRKANEQGNVPFSRIWAGVDCTDC